MRSITLTKKAMRKVIVFHTSTRDAELLRLAALHREISQAELIRQAIREKSGRILAGTDNGPVPVEAG